jgi:amino acid adenylation domain-containing protein
VRASAIDAYDHQDLPFEKLVEELQPERNLNQNPLFQVAFALQNAPRQELKLPHLDAQLLRVDAGTAKFDLTLAFYEKKEGLEGSVEYSPDLFDAHRIERMIGHLNELLEAVVANPRGYVSRLPLLKPSEKQQLLTDWNNTASKFSSNCVHQLFEEHAGSHPEHIAIDSGGQQITYGQLNSRANVLAQRLTFLGVGPEVRVGVAASRSAELIVALLAVLKAGGAYVPLNPGYPDERLLFMVQDSCIQVLLASQEHESRLSGVVRKLPAESAVRLTWLKESGESGLRESIPNTPLRVGANHLAYVIYTSGSTGTPKGVMVTHRNLCNLIEAQTGFARITRESRVAQVNSPSFDVSQGEIWGALTTGATLCILPQELLPGPQAVGWLQEQSASFLMATPSFLGALPIEDLPNLETVVSGGEPCTAEMVSAWCKGRRFVNAYGPTETTIWSTCVCCLASRDQPSIGQPIRNTEVYVLDRQLEPVPIGIPGELFIGGVGVARGYLNRPDLTAEQFLPNPFSQTQGARLYRTGDKVQYRTDGSLEFLGRLDHQVKIRGYRIELGEIESVLRQYPDVHEAVVLVRVHASGDKWLVGYVTTRSQYSPDLRALRSFLKERLPEYMLPADFVWLEKLPLNSSGKLDRQALPAPDRAHPELGVALEGPGTNTEKSLAAIWKELLEIGEVGLHDNFFELGGHSLLATQVLARIQTRLKVEVSLRVLFDNPTLAELARTIEQAQSNGPGSVPPVRRRPT